MSWKNTIKTEVKKTWKDTIQFEAPKHGKDGAQGPAGKDGRHGKDGKNGKDGHEWHLLDGELDHSLGKHGHLALHTESGKFYRKENNRWIEKGSLKGKDGKNGLTVFGGKGDKGDTGPQGPAGSGGASSLVIATTTTDLTITTEDILIVKGAGAVNIHLKNIASATTKTEIKNRSTQNCTVDISGGGTIEDDTSFIIPPKSAFVFVPETGVQYYVD